MILIKNATLISMSEKEEKIQENMNILIDKNEIVKIFKNDESENINENEFDKIIDATRENSYARINKYS